jgi:hypothetical protein
VALLSRCGRDARSRELAEWLELPADAVEGFVERMELSWQRQQAWEMAEAQAQVEAEVTVKAPRIFAPRIAVPS